MLFLVQKMQREKGRSVTTSRTSVNYSEVSSVDDGQEMEFGGASCFAQYRRWLFGVIVLTSVIYVCLLTKPTLYEENHTYRFFKKPVPARASLSLIFPAAGPSPRPTDPTSQLIDLRDFHYTINNDICDVDDVFIVSFVHSAPANAHNREAIRRAWGGRDVLASRGLKTRLVFLLAAVADARMQSALEAENRHHHDIVQGSFVDAYRNLTYKQAMGMKWVATYCAQAEFVLKSDDDTWIDMYQVAQLLLPRRGQKRLCLCNEWIGMPVLRDRASKWYVSEAEYEGRVFKPYCSGWAMLLTTDVARGLDHIAPSMPYFWIDDVHVSGPLLDKIGVKRIQLNQYFVFGHEPLLKWAEDAADETPVKFIFGTTWGKDDIMSKLWEKTVRVHEKLRLAGKTT
ncbi:PREDICTED: beta-1,3-galactosyltransferase 5-like [Priapulus caudatus]|uniref:Hexosyltransferase n=1 Tax=Priapulus caudatus TaxID=37621 RepID=A0ABM1DT73_PRICU|nr:PREDICTED: beta-1,3-galactosyltransferase 5-like [Priapulus caudatus]